MDRTFCLFEIKNQRDDDGTFSGYGSVFGNVDSYGDTVAKGAFKKTIADTKSGAAPWPAFLMQHGADQNPIGILTDLSEDDNGLKLKGRLAIKTRRGLEAYNLLRMTPRPALNGLSIGYRAKEFEEVPDIPLEAGSAVVIVVAWRDYPPADQPYRPRSLAK